MDENEMNQIPEEKPASGGESRPVWKIALVVAAVAAVILVVAAVAAHMMGGSTGDPTEPSVSATVPTDGDPNAVTGKGTYTAADDQMQASANVVVASIGDVELLNSELQIYYWMQVNSFLSQYGAYASMVGLDYTQPLDTQMCVMAEDMTWQQYFLQGALESWQAYQALCLAAADAGFDQSNEDYQTYAANIRQELAKQAESLGYASLKEAIAELVGESATEDDYVKWMQQTYLGALYYDALLAERIPASDADIAAYFDKYAEEYGESGLTKETGNYIDVRHILIMPKGGTLSEDGQTTTYSEEEWEAARLEAQDILDQWLSGDATQEEFAELANSHSDDSDGTDGGLYTDVYQGQMVEEFDAWCFDEARVVGDYGLVKTRFGYHVMYFAGRTPIWYATAKSDLETETANAIIPELLEQYEITVDYQQMVLGQVDLT